MDIVMFGDSFMVILLVCIYIVSCLFMEACIRIGQPVIVSPITFLVSQSCNTLVIFQLERSFPAEGAFAVGWTV